MKNQSIAIVLITHASITFTAAHEDIPRPAPLHRTDSMTINPRFQSNHRGYLERNSPLESNYTEHAERNSPQISISRESTLKNSSSLSEKK